MGITVAVCAKKDRVAQMLSEHLNEMYGAYLSACAFDDVEKLISFAAESKCHLCLVTKGSLSAYQTEQLLKTTEKLHFFTQDKEDDGIYLYRSAEAIGRDIFALYTEEFAPENGQDGNHSHRRQMKVIGFYSPVRSILQSSLALTMGQLMAKERKVLYLNFEPYSGFEYLMQKHFTKDLSDLLFYVKEDTSKFACRLKGITQQVGNLFYVPPVFAYPDLEGVDASLWQRLLQSIVDDTEYDLLILDLTEQICGLFRLLAFCDEIYTCHEGSDLAQAKLHQYEEMLSYLQKQEILEKTRKVTIPTFRSMPGYAALLTHGEMAQFVESMMT